MWSKREMDGVGAANEGRHPNSAENCCETNNSGFRNPNRGEEDDLYAELWHACAGPSVYVPRGGEKVFYFPQGHLEQVAAFTQQDGPMEIPVYDLPSKILCRVMSVQLKAEAYTDEVFAQITLLPVAKQDELSSGEKHARRLPCGTTACSFSKTLTPSDTSPHGGFSVPKRHAGECFPPLDMSQQPAAQELVAKDLHGFEWHFRHIYRGQPKRHLLTSGWSTFVNSRKLVPGDACIFLSGENGELRIGIRRAIEHYNVPSASKSLISGHSMQLGILASASHAIATGTMFIVYYRPWTNPSEFMIPLDQYMKSTEVDYSVGMRVQMQLEAQEYTRRYAGTVIGKEDIDGIRWPGSEWRCIKVQWDGILDTYIHPERVCPWSIEPLESVKKEHIPILPDPVPKRAHVLDPSLARLGGFAKDDRVQISVKHTPERDLQGQDYNEVGYPQQHAHKPLLTDAHVPSNVTFWASNLKMENQLHFLKQIPLQQSLGGSVSYPDDEIPTSSLPNQRTIFTTYGACDSISISRELSVLNANSSDSESHGWQDSESKDDNEVPFGRPGSCSRYKLFGVSLTDDQPELPSPQVTAFSKASSLLSVSPMSLSGISATIPVSEPSKNILGATSEKQRKKCCSVNRSCTKVLKHGTALGRSIDLSRFIGYDELISELDWMFDFGGSLVNGSSGWHVTCTDNDGDIMLSEDYPWQDFQFMVQKMIICPKDGINKLNPRSTDATNL